MFSIDKDVPMQHKVSDRISWPWKDMDVGDSVLISDETIIGKAQVRCHVYGKTTGKKFSTRSTPEGLRVWRTE